MTSENEGLGRFAARGALSTVAGQVIRLAVQLVGVVILARLLGPTDYGLIAMVVAIVGVGEVLRDFGLSSAVMRAESLSVTQRNNLFWINTLIGAVLTIAIILLSNPIADLYGQPELVGICIAISFTFLLNGMATQYRAGLARNLKFGYLAWLKRRPRCWAWSSVSLSPLQDSDTGPSFGSSSSLPRRGLSSLHS